VITPNSDILIDGFRLDQIYTSEKAKEEERKGMVRNGEMTCDCDQLVHFTLNVRAYKEERCAECEKKNVVCSSVRKRVFF
jgi:hypothetical protein